jgi:predicted DCC family thiol-disulfide oxidoreductase YuxK
VSAVPPVILFDGICHLCNGAVRFVLRHDRQKRFVFAPLQSKAATTVLARYPDADSLPDSIVLADARGLHTRSDAAFGIARQLGFPWSWLAMGRLLPRPVRDGVYDWIARRRYRWFGRREACMVPTDEVRDRFLT